jgi:predicted RNase H-like nuclease (RuvC/YqgF family)
MKITVKELDEMLKARVKLADELMEAMMARATLEKAIRVRATLEKAIRWLTKENDELKEKVSSLESEVNTQVFRKAGRPAKIYQIEEINKNIIIRRETAAGSGVFDCVGVLNDE